MDTCLTQDGAVECIAIDNAGVLQFLGCASGALTEAQFERAKNTELGLQ